MTAWTRLTVADIDRAVADPRWLGFGYIGGRRNTLTSDDPEAPADPASVHATDERVIAWANEHRWTYEDLFAWANSKNGRWLGDVMFGSDEHIDARFGKAIGWGLLAKPKS